MRIWATLSVVLLSSCLESVDDVRDAGAATPDASQPSRVEETPGRCDWDGGGLGVCQAVTAFVFDGTSCRTACTSRQPGEPGIFETNLECELFCLPPDSGM